MDDVDDEGMETEALARVDGRVRLVSRPARRPAADEVTLAVAVAGICRTDVLVAEGKIDAADPVVLGHELAGVVLERGAAVRGLEIGARATVRPFVGCGTCVPCARSRDELCERARQLGVHLDGAFASRLTLPARLVHALPRTIDPRAGAYAEPVAAVLATRDACEDGARVAILGDNRIARLTARVLVASGVRDATIVAHPAALEPSSVDVAIETVPSPEVMRAAVEAVRVGGTVVLKSRSAASLEIPLARAVDKQITFRAVRYAPFEDAIALLPRIELRDLFGPSFALDDFDRAFAAADEQTKRFFTFGDPDVWDR